MKAKSYGKVPPPPDTYHSRPTLWLAVRLRTDEEIFLVLLERTKTGGTGVHGTRHKNASLTGTNRYVGLWLQVLP